MLFIGFILIPYYLNKICKEIKHLNEAKEVEMAANQEELTPNPVDNPNNIDFKALNNHKKKMVQPLDENNFYEQTKTGVAVVFFSAYGNNSCLQLLKVIEELAEEMTNVKFYKIDVAYDYEIAHKFNIINAPTIIIFLNGKQASIINNIPYKNKLKNKILESCSEHLKNQTTPFT